MLKFRYKRLVSENVYGRCDRHPRYNPEDEGHDKILDRCSTCYALWGVYEARLKLDQAIRDFERRSAPWMVRRPPKKDSKQPSPSVPFTESGSTSND